VLTGKQKAPFTNRNLNFERFDVGEKLVETKLFSSILLEDVPVLNDVYQADFTLNYVAA
jgi:hypothetical protein